MGKKLCLIYNFAPLYRLGIFKLIDEKFDCDWYFGRNGSDIKTLDLSLLKRAKEVPVMNLPFSCYWQKGIVKLLFRKEYKTYFLLGELKSISTWAFIIFARLLFPRKHVYFWSHGWYGRETRIKKILKKMFFKLADGTFLYGNYARSLMIENGFRGANLFVIHNSLDYDRQLELRKTITPTGLYKKHFGNDRPNLIFIGRLTFSKKLDLLLEALKLLKEKGKVFNLTLVGDGEAYRNLHDLAVEKELCEYVWFYGACYDEQTNAELIFNADLCVSPGNVGLTAMHSMMFGTPVITHGCFKYQGPEFESIHPGVTGDFFEMGNAGSLAACISAWFDRHESERNKVREACYEEIDTSWNPYFQIGVIKKYLIVE